MIDVVVDPAAEWVAIGNLREARTALRDAADALELAEDATSNAQTERKIHNVRMRVISQTEDVNRLIYTTRLRVLKPSSEKGEDG